MSLTIKIGQAVKTRATRTGAEGTGRFVGRTKREGSPGDWLKVNHAEKGKPSEIKLYREAQITPV